MVTGLPLLSLVIWVPIIGGILVLTVSNRKDYIRWLSLLFSVLTFIVSWLLYIDFDTSTAAMQFQEKATWITAFKVYYHLGIDGISMPLIILTTFSTVLVVIAGWKFTKYKLAQYMASFLIMEGLMNGTFAALDAVLFYVFFESTLIPLFLIIGIWGGPNRIYATLKFFLYTFLGSVFLLISILYLRSVTGSFSILEFHLVPLDMQAQIAIFLAFLLAFGIKIPMWPVHTWLPDAHVEAPTGGSVILAAIALKLGAYGLVRFSLPIAPDASLALNWFIITLSLIAIIYIGLVAIVQPDLKKLIAYSSVAHMGFVTLGLFIAFALARDGAVGEGSALGLAGALVQMISHGLISAALFLCVGVLYDRMHTRIIGDYGGVVNTMPIFASFWVLFAMANTGLPGTSGFVGEFLVILASFQASFWYAFFASITLILSAAYSLWMIKRVIFGEVANDNVAALKDLNSREFLVLGFLAIAVLLLGIWPQPLLEVMHASIEHLLSQMVLSKLT
ncbi:proton-translocating NADH-quinone oxidoreductase chain M [Candidatus Nitrosoglobus terrae]|uniref:NADH-quinone oxidoreductase subunit M n=1 Tax=Candidatus Nitrosoglobus terrae TaxID=1630141 RepID=A0A1Q2SKZ7_9GAMM|nr:NADH-quinone oxidoreductase subunit M [Candidatus Nitrosoglobus terrae]BAW79789.1 proton-translocating NADH-quinone oxidoreductase chain M [Candidatus Nitrosoglobus terrae]